MHAPRNWADILVLAAVLALLMPGRADAYVDPGSGSYLFQILIAGGMAVLYGIKHFWSKIRFFFSTLLGRQ